MSPDPQPVREAANRLRPPHASGRLAEPIPVMSPAGELERWFVAVVRDELLTGFLMLTPDLRLDRFSEFTVRVTAITWLDPNTVRATAERTGHRASGTPALSYDGVLARLAWAVPVPDGTVYVAGESAWLAPDG